MAILELTEEELRLVRTAVRALLADYGRDQQDLVRSLRAILKKLDESEAAAAASLS